MYICTKKLKTNPKTLKVMATYRIIYKEDMTSTVGKKKFNTLQELKDEVNASDFSLYDVQSRKSGFTAYLNKWTYKLDSKGNRIY